MKIIIPSYEPDEQLIQVVTTIKTALPKADIIIVNDGSAPHYDGYYHQTLKQGVYLLQHDTNRGKGAALKTAFTYLLENSRASQEAIVTIDSDGQHLVSDMLKVADAIQGKERTLVLGARAFVGKVPFRSRFGNRLTASLFKMVAGQNITDTQTGLRAFSADLLPWLMSLEGERFEYEFNMLLEARKADVTLLEVPIETIYIEENKRSHFRPIVDSLRIYAPFLKFLAASVIATLIDASLFFILMIVTKNLLASVVIARILSSVTQFYLNATHVFKKESRTVRSMVRYGGLVIFLLACHYVMLQQLISIGVGLVLAKLMTEALLFLLSYRVQQTVVFS